MTSGKLHHPALLPSLIEEYIEIVLFLLCACLAIIHLYRKGNLFAKFTYYMTVINLNYDSKSNICVNTTILRILQC